MDYCTKWKLVGLAIGLAPYFSALLVGTLCARWPKRYWLAVLLSGGGMVAILIVSVPVSLILWNGLRPAICDRIE